MSGKIMVKVRKGNPLDKRYKYYPEAYWIVEDEEGRVGTLSPSYDDLCNVLMDFRKHELKVDVTRERKNYTSKLIHKLGVLLEDIKKTKLTEYDKANIEPIYKTPRRVNHAKR